MFEKPQWKASLTVTTIDGESVVVFDEDESILLTGAVFPKIAPHLNGKNSVSQLLSLVDGMSAAEMNQVLRSLERSGCIREGINGMPRAEAAFWHSLNVEAGTAEDKLRRTAVKIDVCGLDNAAEMRSALEQAGVRVAAEGGLQLVLVDDYLNADIGSFNRRALERGSSWMLVKPVGKTLWIGPEFRPGVTGCWECLAQRLRANRQMEAFLQISNRSRQSASTSIAAMPSYVAAALHLTAGEIAKMLVMGKSPTLDGVIVTLNTLTLGSERHTLTRRPQCPACGDQDYLKRSPMPVRLTESPKQFQSDGGHRVQHPDATYRRLEKQISSITGVVNSLKDLTHDQGQGLTYSYAAGHNFALLGKDLRFVMQNLRGRSGGKGCSDTQAKVSAVCEAIERYSGVYRGDEISRVCSLDELGEDAVHPNALMGFSERQFKNRLRWNSVHGSPYHRIPEELDAKRPISWTPTWSLTRQKFVWVPSAYCYYGHPDLVNSPFCSCDANGNAAGNTLEEAILQGFFEVVERDSVSLWWYNRIPRPGVDLESCDDPYIAKLHQYYRSIGRDIWVLDITADMSVPTFAAVSRRTGHPVEDIILGFGTHFNARLAVLRALTEANQFLPSVARKDAQGNTQYFFHDKDAIEWWKTATIATDPYVTPDLSVPLRQVSEFSDPSSSDIKRDVELCSELVSQRGMEMLVLDQTQPDLELSVAKVIVPGMRHFWKRFGPGRLYTTPVEMGWIARPRTEEELNPVGIFF